MNSCARRAVKPRPAQVQRQSGGDQVEGSKREYTRAAAAQSHRFAANQLLSLVELLEDMNNSDHEEDEDPQGHDSAGAPHVNARASVRFLEPLAHEGPSTNLPGPSTRSAPESAQNQEAKKASAKPRAPDPVNVTSSGQPGNPSPETGPIAISPDLLEAAMGIDPVLSAFSASADDGSAAAPMNARGKKHKHHQPDPNRGAHEVPQASPGAQNEPPAAQEPTSAASRHSKRPSTSHEPAQLGMDASVLEAALGMSPLITRSSDVSQNASSPKKAKRHPATTVNIPPNTGPSAQSPVVESPTKDGLAEHTEKVQSKCRAVSGQGDPVDITPAVMGAAARDQGVRETKPTRPAALKDASPVPRASAGAAEKQAAVPMPGVSSGLSGLLGKLGTGAKQASIAVPSTGKKVDAAPPSPTKQTKASTKGCPSAKAPVAPGPASQTPAAAATAPPQRQECTAQKPVDDELPPVELVHKCSATVDSDALFARLLSTQSPGAPPLQRLVDTESSTQQPTMHHTTAKQKQTTPAARQPVPSSAAPANKLERDVQTNKHVPAAPTVATPSQVQPQHGSKQTKQAGKKHNSSVHQSYASPQQQPREQEKAAQFHAQTSPVQVHFEEEPKTPSRPPLPPQAQITTQGRAQPAGPKGPAEVSAAQHPAARARDADEIRNDQPSDHTSRSRRDSSLPAGAILPRTLKKYCEVHQTQIVVPEMYF